MTVGGAAEQLRTGWNLQAIYAPPAAPYGMPGVQYPPVFILLTALLTKISGLSVLLVERLLAWGFYVASAGMVGRCVWQETRQRWLAIVAAGLPFCFWNVIIFAHAARVDPAALFFSLCAAYTYRRSPSPNLLLVAFWGTLAFFTKQTYLAVSAAIFFDLALKAFSQQRQEAAQPELKTLPRKKLIIFVAASLVWLVIFGGFTGWWSGGAFFTIFEPGRAGSFIFDKAPGFISIFVFDHLPLLLLAGGGLWLQLRVRKNSYFWPLYSLFAGLMCITIVKDGAVDYYFNELSYVLSFSIAFCLAASKSIFSWISARYWTILKTSLLVLQLIIASGMLIFWSHWKDFEAGQAAYNEGLTLVRQAQAQNRPALTLVDAFLLETGQAAKIGDYFIYAVLLKNNLRDSAPLIADLQAGRYDFVLVESFVRWPAPVEAALTSSYNLRTINADDKRSLYHLYELKNKK